MIALMLAQWHPIATEPHAISLSTLLGLTICVLLVIAARWGRRGNQ